MAWSWLQALVSSLIQAARAAFYVSAGIRAKLSSSGLCLLLSLPGPLIPSFRSFGKVW